MSEYRDAQFLPPKNPFIARDGRQYRDCQPPADELVAAGFYPVFREPQLAGNYRETRTFADGMWLVGWEEYDPQAERLAALAPYGQTVATLCGLLAGFGVTLPCERADAKAAVHAAVKADPSKAADAILAVDLIHQLDAAGVTDSDIYLIATMS